jgi:hypothetical protein
MSAECMPQTSRIVAERNYVPDSWGPHELPVLIAIADWDEETTTVDFLRLETLTERLGRPPDGIARVAKAVARLVEAGYVSAQTLTYMGAIYPDFMIRGLTPLGLQATGAWPRESDDLVEVLLRTLEAQADALEASQPEEASRIRQVGKFLAGTGLDVAKSIAIAVATRAATGQ